MAHPGDLMVRFPAPLVELPTRTGPLFVNPIHVSMVEEWAEGLCSRVHVRGADCMVVLLSPEATAACIGVSDWHSPGSALKAQHDLNSVEGVV